MMLNAAKLKKKWDDPSCMRQYPLSMRKLQKLPETSTHIFGFSLCMCLCLCLFVYVSVSMSVCPFLFVYVYVSVSHFLCHCLFDVDIFLDCLKIR